MTSDRAGTHGQPQGPVKGEGRIGTETPEPAQVPGQMEEGTEEPT